MDKIEKDYLQEENMQSNDQGHSIANLAYKGIFAFCLDEVFYDSFAQTKKHMWTKRRWYLTVVGSKEANFIPAVSPSPSHHLWCDIPSGKLT